MTTLISHERGNLASTPGADGNADPKPNNNEAVLIKDATQPVALTNVNKVDPAVASASAPAQVRPDQSKPSVVSKSEPSIAKVQSASGCSERKITANRRNAQKSTGPRTPQGKVRSAMNALKHGALAHKALSEPGSKEWNHNLYALFKLLWRKYGADNVQIRILIELLIAAYRRCMTTLDLESSIHSQRSGASQLIQEADRLHRYATANEKAVQRLLDKLEEIKRERSARADEALAASRESGDEGEVDGEELEPEEAASYEWNESACCEWEAYDQREFLDDEDDWVPDPSLSLWWQIDER